MKELRIADFGLRIYALSDRWVVGANRSNLKSAIRNPQSEIELWTLCLETSATESEAY
jgi:hypothetical protein